MRIYFFQSFVNSFVQRGTKKGDKRQYLLKGFSIKEFHMTTLRVKAALKGFLFIFRVPSYLLYP